MATVNLISYTQPHADAMDKNDVRDLQELIAYCARVSNPGNQNNSRTSRKLLEYMIKHKHWSPFEMVNVCLEIVTTRDIGRQILRHRSFSFQEFSQRYSTATQLEDLHFRTQGKTNRQVGDEEYPISQNLDVAVQVHEAQQKCLKVYDKLIESGIARECARMILPLNTQTTLYMSGSVRSFIHYIQLRSKENTQKEHREIALEMKYLFAKTFPTIAKALEWNNI
jgi:thymidylate synthase (FAD)